MPFVSVTRLHLASRWSFPRFVYYALGTSKQARRSRGFLAGWTSTDGEFGFWTSTVWDSLEAMRAGRACVVTDVGGNAEAVGEGATGRVVPANDPDAFAAGLRDALGEPDRLAAWGAEARRRWQERFTAAHMVRDTETLYRAARAGGPRSRTPADVSKPRG